MSGFALCIGSIAVATVGCSEEKASARSPFFAKDWDACWGRKAGWMDCVWILWTRSIEESWPSSADSRTLFTTFIHALSSR